MVSPATSGARMAVTQVYAALGVVQIEERASWLLLDPKEPVIPAKSETVRVMMHRRISLRSDSPRAFSSVSSSRRT